MESCGALIDIVRGQEHSSPNAEKVTLMAVGSKKIWGLKIYIIIISFYIITSSVDQINLVYHSAHDS